MLERRPTLWNRGAVALAALLVAGCAGSSGASGTDPPPDDGQGDLAGGDRPDEGGGESGAAQGNGTGGDGAPVGQGDGAAQGDGTADGTAGGAAAPADPAAAACAQQQRERPDCIMEVGFARVCQGVRVTPDHPPPGPERICVCHECNTDADCDARGGGTCQTRPGVCFRPATRLCVRPDDPCRVCPGPCNAVRDPRTGTMTAECAPPQPVP